MIEKILAAISGLFVLLFGFYKLGEKNQKNKNNEKTLENVVKNARFRRKINNISVNSKREWLREKFGAKHAK